jgi:hypothetical protein
MKAHKRGLPIPNKELPYKTIQEMCAGAKLSGTDVMSVVTQAGVLSRAGDGKRYLRGLLPEGAYIDGLVSADSEGYPIVLLEVRTSNGQLAEFTEPLEGFPSDELITKVLLVA